MNTPQHYMVIRRDNLTGRLSDGYYVGFCIHYGDESEAEALLKYKRSKSEGNADDYFIMWLGE